MDVEKWSIVRNNWKISTFDFRIGRETIKRGRYVIIVPKHLQQKNQKSTILVVYWLTVNTCKG